MILPMLKAVDTMLKDGDANSIPYAKAVLAEIIRHLEEGPAPKAVYKDSDLDPEAAKIQEELTGD